MNAFIYSFIIIFSFVSITNTIFTSSSLFRIGESMYRVMERVVTVYEFNEIFFPRPDEASSNENPEIQLNFNAMTIKFDKMLRQNYAIDSSDEILNEINVVELKKYYASVNAAINKFKRITSTSTNETIIEELDTFIKHFDQEVDSQMMDFISNDLDGNSLVKRYSDVVQKYSDNFTYCIQASPSSLIYQMQISTLFMALNYANIFEYATMIKNKFQNKSFNEPVWIMRRQELIDKFKSSVRASSDYIKDQKSFSSYLNLKSGEIKSHKFRKVFQTFWQREGDLNGKWMNEYCDGISFDCREYQYKNREVLSLFKNPLIAHTSTSEWFIFSNDAERIYDNYFIDNVKYGRNTKTAKNVYVIKEEWTEYRWKNESRKKLMYCTCDQINAPNTARKIYAGRILAESGLVITGVRFEMTQNVLYLNIQTGKLIEFGIVDPSTLKWHEPPKDLTSNTFEIDYNRRNFALDDVYFTDGNVLIGIQLILVDNLIRTKITGSKIIKQENSFDILESSSSEHCVYTKLTELKVRGKIQGIHHHNFTIKRSDSDNVSIQFDKSDEITDAGQTTIPFFDGSEVIQQFPLVLSGIGYVYYTNEYYAGYLKPILKSVDMKFVV